MLAGRSAGIRVLAGTAERMPLPDGSADAVFVGDAFHWFDGDAAVSELARVVAARTAESALLWNHWLSDGDDRTVNTLDPPIPAEAQELFDAIYVSSGRAAAIAEMADPLDAVCGRALHAALQEAFARSEQLSGRDLVDLFSTMSAIALASRQPSVRSSCERSCRCFEPYRTARDHDRQALDAPCLTSSSRSAAGASG